jgi:putative NADH-flavin reductase
VRITLFGATGMIGSRILNELLLRGHQVTAVVRNPSKIQKHPNVTAVAGDVLSKDSVVDNASGADAVISAYAPPPDSIGNLLAGTRNLIEALPLVGVKRLLVVGGAGSLEVAPGVQLVDTPGFPAAWKPYGNVHRDALQILREQASAIDWTSFSPPAIIEPGERTGKFRLGSNELILDKSGESRISAEDYAVAAVDEIERPRYIRQRFTAGY